MTIFSLPYGDSNIQICIDPPYYADLLLPNTIDTIGDSGPVIVQRAVDNSVGDTNILTKVEGTTQVVIAINDKSRPVPNEILLYPLLKKLKSIGLDDSQITFLIASGTHVPMHESEFTKVIDKTTIAKYKVHAHDCDAKDLIFVGHTTRGTPVWVNYIFHNANIRIVVGDIELHHFAGFSGGLKSAAIGLCGRETINVNHSLLLDPRSTIGNCIDNPLRQDIDEIGKMIKVDLALNAVINEKKEISSAWFGKPDDVFRAGVETVMKHCQVKVDKKYDIVIASAGGYPKDINLYQAQKAMTNASMFCKEGGAILLVAKCLEGVGSQAYLDFMQGLHSNEEVLDRFIKTGFAVGPHKAYQIARILQKNNVYLHSSLTDLVVSQLLLTPLTSLENFIDCLGKKFSSCPTIAVLPYATACIPMKE